MCYVAYERVFKVLMSWLRYGGGSRGGTLGPPSPPYFSTKMRPEVPKKGFWRPGPPPLSQGLDDRPPPPPLSEGLNPPLR